MKKSAACLLAVAAAVVFMATPVCSSRVLRLATHAYEHFCDGTGPVPPPIPQSSDRETSIPTYLADGTGPTPPPVPMQLA